LGALSSLAIVFLFTLPLLQNRWSKKCSLWAEN